MQLNSASYIEVAFLIDIVKVVTKNNKVITKYRNLFHHVYEILFFHITNNFFTRIKIKGTFFLRQNFGIFLARWLPDAFRLARSSEKHFMKFIHFEVLFISVGVNKKIVREIFYGWDLPPGPIDRISTYR